MVFWYQMQCLFLLIRRNIIRIILALHIFLISITFFKQNEYEIIFVKDFKFYFSENHSILSLDIPLNADIEDKTIYLKSSIMEFNVTLKI